MKNVATVVVPEGCSGGFNCANDLKVDRVAPGSVADRAGVVLGMKLVQFQGIRITGAGWARTRSFCASTRKPWRFRFEAPLCIELTEGAAGFCCSESLVVNQVNAGGRAQVAGVTLGMRLLSLQDEAVDGKTWDFVKAVASRIPKPWRFQFDSNKLFESECRFQSGRNTKATFREAFLAVHDTRKMSLFYSISGAHMRQMFGSVALPLAGARIREPKKKRAGPGNEWALRVDLSEPLTDDTGCHTTWKGVSKVVIALPSDDARNKCLFALSFVSSRRQADVENFGAWAEAMRGVRVPSVPVFCAPWSHPCAALDRAMHARRTTAAAGRSQSLRKLQRAVRMPFKLRLRQLRSRRSCVLCWRCTRPRRWPTSPVFLRNIVAGRSSFWPGCVQSTRMPSQEHCIRVLRCRSLARSVPTTTTTATMMVATTILPSSARHRRQGQMLLHNSATTTMTTATCERTMVPVRVPIRM